MSTKYVKEFASTTDFLNNAPDRGTSHLGVGSVAEALYINRANAAVEIPVKGLVSLTGNTSLTKAAHSERMLALNVAAGATITLPAATGSGDRYFIYIGTTLTSGSFVLQVASASDYMRGFAYVKTDDSATSTNTYATANTATLATESDTITWNRTTTGTAIIGDYIEAVDIASGVWAVATENNASGTEATPFSAAV